MVVPHIGGATAKYMVPFNVYFGFAYVNIGPSDRDSDGVWTGGFGGVLLRVWYLVGI